MALETLGLKIDTEFSAIGTNAAIEAFQKVEQTFSSMSSFIKTNTIDAFVGLEEKLISLKKTADLSANEMNSMTTALLKMSSATGESVVGLAEIASIGGSLGVPKANLEEFTGVVNKMAIAFDMGAEDASIAAAKISTVFGRDLGKASLLELGDTLNILADRTSATVPQLAAFDMQFGSTARQLGLTLEQASSLGAAFISMGMDASDAATRMTAGFREMMEEKEGGGIASVSALVGMTKESFRSLADTDMMAAFKKVVDGLGGIQSSTERVKQATEIFGATGAKAALSLVGNWKVYENALGAVSAGHGSMEKEFQTVMGSFGQQIKVVSAIFTNFGIAVGRVMTEDVAPWLKIAIDRLQIFFGSITQEQLQKIAKIGLLIMGFSSGLAILAGIGAGFTAIGYFATFAVTAITGIGLAVAGLALGLGAFEEIKAFEKLSSSAKGSRAEIKSFFVWLKEMFFSIPNFILTIGDAIGKGWAMIVDDITSMVMAIPIKMGESLMSIGDMMGSDRIKSLGRSLFEMGGPTGADLMGEKMTKSQSTVKRDSMMQQLKNELAQMDAQLAEKMVPTAESGLKGLMESKDATTPILNAMKDGATDIGAKIKDAVMKGMEGAKDLLGKDIKIPDMDKLKKEITDLTKVGGDTAKKLPEVKTEISSLKDTIKKEAKVPMMNASEVFKSIQSSLKDFTSGATKMSLESRMASVMEESLRLQSDLIAEQRADIKRREREKNMPQSKEVKLTVQSNDDLLNLFFEHIKKRAEMEGSCGCA